MPVFSVRYPEILLLPPELLALSPFFQMLEGHHECYEFAAVMIHLARVRRHFRSRPYNARSKHTSHDRLEGQTRHTQTQLAGPIGRPQQRISQSYIKKALFNDSHPWPLQSCQSFFPLPCLDPALCHSQENPKGEIIGQRTRYVGRTKPPSPPCLYRL